MILSRTNRMLSENFDNLRRSRTIPIFSSLKGTKVFWPILLLIVFASQDSFARDSFSKERFIGRDDEPWKITARTMSFKEREGVYEAEGDVVISKGGQTLYSEKAIYNIKTGIAELSEGFRLDTGEDVLSGDEGVFDFKNETGRILNGSLFLKDNHFYVKGGVMEKLEGDTYLIKDCHLTACDGVNPAWSITGSEVKVTIEGYGTVKDASFFVRDIPLLYAPYMIFPAKTKRQTGLLPPRFGQSSRNGLNLEVPFFWSISDQADATFYQRYMSKRGYMQGLELRYIVDDESKGAFLFDILSDREDKKMNDPDDTEISPFPRTNDTRYWLRSRADQNLPLGLVARLDTDYVSDQDYLNEFERGDSGFEARPDLLEESGRPVEEKRSPIRTSALRVSRDAEEYSLQALGSYYHLPGNPIRHVTAEPLGGLFFGLLPSNVNYIPAFFTLESDYDYVWREDGQKGHRFSLSPELKFPLWFGRYIEFEPSIRYTLNPQWFGYSQGDMESQSLKTYEASARISTSIDRIYDLKLLDVKRLKHRIRPTVRYAYRGFDGGDDQSPWFEPLEEEGDANLVNFSVENFLDGRLEDDNGNVSYRQLAKLTFSQSFDVEEERRGDEPTRDAEPFEPLFVEMILRPFPELDFFAQTRWDHYDQEITFLDMSLELTVDRSEDRKDKFYIDYQYDIDNQESINLFFEINLTHGLSVGSSLQRRLDLSENISNKYWLQYQRQCWGIKLITEKEDDETSVMLVFQLLGLGDVTAR